MSNNAWIKKLKVGDKVIVLGYGYKDQIGTVKIVGRLYIHVDHGPGWNLHKYCIETGRHVAPGRSCATIVKCTKAKREAMEKAQAISSKLIEISDMMRKRNMTMPVLEQIESLVKKCRKKRRN